MSRDAGSSITTKTFNQVGRKEDFSELRAPITEIKSSVGKPRHTIGRLLGKDGKTYVSKYLLYGDVRSTIEVYSAWIFRLHVLEGARIPEYGSHHDFGTVVTSEEILGIEALSDMRAKDTSSGKSEHIGRFGDKILREKNLRAFAQILVCSLVFAQMDLKPDHLVFDAEGNLSCIDFDQCFYTGIIPPSEKDFENLPLIDTLNPHNFIFNRINNRTIADKTDGIELAKKLGDGFKNEVYGAILKILLMPDFLLNEIYNIIGSCSDDLKKRIIEETAGEFALQKKSKLLASMRESPFFKGFLAAHGDSEKEIILNEIMAFRRNNSFFSEKWSEDHFLALCKQDVDKAYGLIFATPVPDSSLLPLAGAGYRKDVSESVVAAVPPQSDVAAASVAISNSASRTRSHSDFTYAASESDESLPDRSGSDEAATAAAASSKQPPSEPPKSFIQRILSWIWKAILRIFGKTPGAQTPAPLATKIGGERLAPVAPKVLSTRSQSAKHGLGDGIRSEPEDPVVRLKGQL